MVNRLAASTSPYLRQHADNPVDWWAWCDEAFAEARRRDVPILLQRRLRGLPLVPRHGARLVRARRRRRGDERALRQREGRPRGAPGHRRRLHGGDDRAHRTGRLADDLPAHAGRSPVLRRHVLPASTVPASAEAANEAWRERRDEVLAPGSAIVAALVPTARARRGGRADPTRRSSTSREPCWRSGSTRADGGFGGAPKFPPSMVLEFLLRHHERTGDPTSLAMVERHLRGDGARRHVRPARRRLRALLASTPRGWCRTSRRCSTTTRCCCASTCTGGGCTGSPLAERIARETADFLLRDLRHAGGRLRVGARRRHRRRRGTDLRVDAGAAARRARRRGTRRPTAVRGHRRRARSSTVRPRCSCRRSGGSARWMEIRAPAARGARSTSRSRRATTRSSPPGTVWRSPRWPRRACCSIDRSTSTAAVRVRRSAAAHARLVDGRLRRTSRDGGVGEALGVAEDYGDLAEGLLALHQATGELRWLQRGRVDCSTSRSRASATDTAGSSTPPTTPRR